MPLWLMSSSLPINGLINVAPAFAASKAWFGEKQSVTFVRIPSPFSAFTAFSPSLINGTFTTMFLWIFARSRPSFMIPSKSVERTSALMGPSTMAQISSRSFRKSFPSFATRLGLVVTPSRTPICAASLISPMLAVSIKNFIGTILHLQFILIRDILVLFHGNETELVHRKGRVLDQLDSDKELEHDFGQAADCSE